MYWNPFVYTKWCSNLGRSHRSVFVGRSWKRNLHRVSKPILNCSQRKRLDDVYSWCLDVYGWCMSSHRSVSVDRI